MNDSAPIPSQKATETHFLLISALRPVSVCGLGIFWAWFFCLIFSHNPYLQLDVSLESSLVLRIAMLAGIVISLIVLFFIRLPMTFNRILVLPLLVITALPAPFCVIASHFFNIPDVLLFISWALSGCGFAIMLMEWPWVFMTFWKRKVNFFIVASSAIGALIYLFVSSLLGQYQFIALTALPFLSLFVYLYVRHYINIDIRRQVSTTETTQLFNSTAVVIIAYYILFGFTTCTLIVQIPLSFTVLVFSGCIVAAALVALLVEVPHRKYFPFALKLRYAFPFVAVCIVVMMFCDNQAWLYVNSVLFTLLAAVMFSNYAAIVSIGSGHLPSPKRILTRGTFEPYIGYLAGVTIYYVLLLEPFGAENDRAITFFYLTLILLVAVVGFLIPIPSNIVADKEDATASQEGRFKTKCVTLAQRSHLSERELEVFLLLSKGRNAQFISSSLSISPYTAKTHIYHIYQKLGISSHQELINLVDKQSRDKL